MSERIAKLNSLVQQEVANILAKEIEFPSSYFVTVSRTEVADDAESAKIWISVMPATHQQAVLDIVTKQIKDIQSILNKRLVMKFVPKLTFLIDESNERADRITKVLDHILSRDLGLSLDAEEVEKDRVERDQKKDRLGLQPGQALNPKKKKEPRPTTGEKPVSPKK
jgi:ribosome-binding factor A